MIRWPCIFFKRVEGEIPHISILWQANNSLEPTRQVRSVLPKKELPDVSARSS